MKLRKITKNDAETLIAWRNDNAAFFPPSAPVTPTSHGCWFDQYNIRPWDHMYMVTHAASPVGTVGIDVQTATIQRVMRGRPEGPGAMSEALLTLMEIYSLPSYKLEVLLGNERAIGFYERLGFSGMGRRSSFDVWYVVMGRKWLS